MGYGMVSSSLASFPGYSVWPGNEATSSSVPILCLTVGTVTPVGLVSSLTGFLWLQSGSD